jgi:hypothetical protein
MYYTSVSHLLLHIHRLFPKTRVFYKYIHCRVDQELTGTVSYGVYSTFQLTQVGMHDRQAYLLTHRLFPCCKSCNCFLCCNMAIRTAVSSSQCVVQKEEIYVTHRTYLSLPDFCTSFYSYTLQSSGIWKCLLWKCLAF